MKIYIAAPWKDRADIGKVSSLVESKGHTLTHKWWEVEDIPESDRTVEVLKSQAYADWEGVATADTILLINSAKSEGKAVEQGIAIALKKPIIVVGKRGEFSANVFHYLPNYHWNDTLEEALDLLEELEWIA